MNCPRHEDISAYVDDALAPDQRRHFLLHLGECRVCRMRLEALALVRDDLHALPSPGLGFDLAAQFEERARLRPAPRRPARTAWFGWGSGGAVVALSLAAGVWLGGLLVGSASVAAPASAARVFDPVPPGGLCAAPELCRLTRGMR